MTEVESLRAQLAKVRSDLDTMIRVHDEVEKERDAMRLRADEIEAAMDAAQAAVVSDCIDHVELNGHIDIAKQCCDYLDHDAMDRGDQSGKLRDFVTSLSVVVQQFDKQRRRANWHEAGYEIARKNLGTLIEQRDTALATAERLTRERSCPCLLTTPCHERCTCINPLSSSGCRRCCAYGSVEQRTAMAVRIAGLIDAASQEGKP